MILFVLEEGGVWLYEYFYFGPRCFWAKIWVLFSHFACDNAYYRKPTFSLISGRNVHILKRFVSDTIWRLQFRKRYSDRALGVVENYRLYIHMHIYPSLLSYFSTLCSALEGGAVNEGYELAATLVSALQVPVPLVM